MSSAIVLPVLALCFCTWCVYLGGLASMQAICQNAPNDNGSAGLAGGVGFPSSQQCSSIYSYWWFVMAFEFVAIVFGFIAAMSTNMLASWRMSALGMFVIATILYIEASNSFYSVLVSSPYYGDNQAPQIHRIRTVVAGAIMTAVMNGIAVIVLGMRDEDVYATREPHTIVDKGPVHTTGVATAV